MDDAYRVDKGGKGSFDQVIRGLGFLRDGGVEWNALTTVHAANGDHGAAVYRFLRDELGCRFMQFIPMIERAAEVAEGVESRQDRPLYAHHDEGVTPWSVEPEQYGGFLSDDV